MSKEQGTVQYLRDSIVMHSASSASPKEQRTAQHLRDSVVMDSASWASAKDQGTTQHLHESTVTHFAPLTIPMDREISRQQLRVNAVSEIAPSLHSMDRARAHLHDSAGRGCQTKIWIFGTRNPFSSADCYRELGSRLPGTRPEFLFFSLKIDKGRSK